MTAAVELELPTVPVAEAFGPVWQGEGPGTGRRCSFLRLGLCNLHCSWCDTPYTWDHTRYDVAAECPDRPAEWIVDQVRKHRTDLLVLTGGEPLMHRGNYALRQALQDLASHEVHVETNGTLIPSGWLADRVALFVVSPKIAQDDDPLSKRLKPAALRWFAERAGLPDARGQAVFKFVARSNDDLVAIGRVVRDLDIWPGDVWVMPEGTTADQLIARHRELAPAIEAAGFNTTTRLHVLLYGDERGR
jgi:7-carboxy-7-deazaguanine synthase